MNELNYHRKYTHEKEEEEKTTKEYLQHIDRVVCTLYSVYTTKPRQ